MKGMILKKISKGELKALGKFKKGDLKRLGAEAEVTLEVEDVLKPSTQRAQEEWEWTETGLWATGWAVWDVLGLRCQRATQ